MAFPQHNPIKKKKKRDSSLFDISEMEQPAKRSIMGYHNSNNIVLFAKSKTFIQFQKSQKNSYKLKPYL